MDAMYDEALRNMEQSLEAFAAKVPQPKEVAMGGGYVLRYQERDVHQALVQKLARLISGLHAARLLLANGFLQEQGALQRILDEFNEDIQFLTFGIIFGDTTDLHREYLEAFYQEEFDDPGSAFKSSQKRPMIPRRKIRAYIARITGVAAYDPSTNLELMRTVDKMYSGFVHGASCHIMEMYYGEPPGFHVRGMLGTTVIDEHREDLWNYFYRSIVSFGLSAKAFGDDVMHASILKYMNTFARANGEDYSRPPKI
jgi:hypothetical protein